jgi:hypothetical protein
LELRTLRRGFAEALFCGFRLPFEFADASDYGTLEPMDRIVIEGWRDAVERDAGLTAMLHPKQGKPRPLALKLSLPRHEHEILLAGGAINLSRKGQASAQPGQ